MIKVDGLFPNVIAAVDAFVLEINQVISEQVKLLFEEKHLYQKVEVDPTHVLDEVMNRVAVHMSAAVRQEIGRILANRLTPSTGVNLVLVQFGTHQRYDAVLAIPNVRLFCTHCKERNVFAPAWFEDVSNQLLQPGRKESFRTSADILLHQLFFIAMQCQHCKGLPEGFILRRDLWKFSLDGRSPIEHIAVPSFIPKAESDLFRDALIGRFTGKNLAGVFYLRAFIEQFARRQTNLKGVRKTGDEIMDAYAKTIPETQRLMLPSLKDWYDRLSEPLHNADEEGAAAVFDDGRNEIERHFDIRRALRIAEKV
jgi:hypothetical protein